LVHPQIAKKNTVFDRTGKAPLSWSADHDLFGTHRHECVTAACMWRRVRLVRQGNTVAIQIELASLLCRSKRARTGITLANVTGTKGCGRILVHDVRLIKLYDFAFAHYAHPIVD